MHTATGFGLAGRRAIVTGHRGGIGRAIATTLEAIGAEVIGLDLPDFDLSDVITLEARAAALITARGPIDVLVNNAGVTVLGSVLDTSLAEVERVFQVNFLAPYALMRAVLPGMIARRRGAIVNIASDQALIGKQVSAAYGASKAAIAQLSRSAALDWARDGIRVNCIAPGSTDTPMLARVIDELALRYPDRFPASSMDAYRAGDPGRVHQRVDALHPGDQRPRRRRVGHVAPPERDAVWDVRRRVSGHRDDAPTLRGEPVRHRRPDPARPAGDQRRPHCAVPPPSTGRITPVMNEAASEARKATTAAISSGRAKRPNGTPARYASIEDAGNRSG